MRTLPGLVSEAISESSDIWFSEVASRLTAFAWKDAACHNFSTEAYGTHRWLHNDPTLERTLIARLQFANSSECLIERLPTASQSHYEKTGLVFSNCCPLDALQSALDLVRVVPSLYATISLYLRSLHILEAPSVDYDVSHSDPDVPFSIFVSVPPSATLGRLRVAESIVHECMHLQLSIVEKVLPLVGDAGVMHFSPWQQRPRPVSGVLHGLYVFAVIHKFFGFAILSQSLTSDERHHAISRRDSIANEVAEACSQSWIHSLNRDGRCLADRLAKCVHLHG